MRKFYFSKLAMSNLLKNRKIYTPYVLMNTGIVIMFYMMLNIALNESIRLLEGVHIAQLILNLGTIIVALFAFVLLIYTNSFLIQQRQKEIGLYHVLGMEKKHIAKLLGTETFFVGFFSIVTGMVLGIAFSQLMIMILLKMMKLNMQIPFSISTLALMITALFFTFLFLITLIYNITKAYTTSPVQLLNGGKVGQKEPRSKFLLSALGIASLSYGYYLAQNVTDPYESIPVFFKAVLAVMLGTYLLFTTVSILVLKFLRSKKSFYYRPTHFIAISGMIHRMKQNAVGLASISILSCAVLVTLSTTFSLYWGVDDNLNAMYSHDVLIHFPNANYEEHIQVIDKKMASYDLQKHEELSYSFVYIFNEKPMKIFLAEDINQILIDPLRLNEDEFALLLSNELHTENQDTLRDLTLRADSYEESRDLLEKILNSNQQNIDIIVVSNQEVRNKVMQLSDQAGGENHFYAFNLQGSYHEKRLFLSEIHEYILPVAYYMDSPIIARDTFHAVYGGLLFVGLFLGLLFLMATAMIIYYKQMSEGYEDKNRYDILQKVGMTHEEIKKSIRRQIIMVFFLPLFVALVHITFAFNVIKLLLTVFGLSNISLFIAVTIGTSFLFAMIYMFVYLLTAKAYYKLLVHSD